MESDQKNELLQHLNNIDSLARSANEPYQTEILKTTQKVRGVLSLPAFVHPDDTKKDAKEPKTGEVGSQISQDQKQNPPQSVIK